MLTTAISISLLIAGSLRAWPQVVKLVKTKDATGVSSFTWMLALSTMIVWEIVGISLGILITAIYNVLMIVSTGSIVALLVWQKHLTAWKPIVVVIVTIAVSISSIAFWSETGIAVIGTIMAIVSFLPQAIKVARHPSSGVSLMTWILAATTASLWMIYGFLINEWVLYAPNFIMIPMTLFIVWKVARPLPAAKPSLAGSGTAIATTAK